MPYTLALRCPEWLRHDVEHLMNDRRVREIPVAHERRQRGRPRKPAAEKLQPITTSVSPAVYALLCRLAEAHGLNVAEVARRIIVGRLRHPAAVAR